MIVPFEGNICVLYAGCQCIIRIKLLKGDGKKILSIMQLKEDIQEVKIFYNATFRKDKVRTS